MAETNGGVVVIKFKADTSDIEKAKKQIGNFQKNELAAERNELAKQRIELGKQRNLIAKRNAETKKYDAITKRIKVNNDKINQSVKNRLSAEKLNLQAQKQQNQMYNKMNGSAKKLSATIGVLSSKMLAFLSVAAIINFSKSILKASSDVVEVQNVVDNAFPNMTKEIDEWAENAVEKFGMSEKAAKEYASMFGMIGRSAGLSEGDAYKIGTNLTALTADIGSMLNMSNEDVYTKLKSGVLSGQTRAMRDLGVSMNEADIQAWLLEKGITAQYSAMTQADKILVRYNYTLEHTKLMQNDFARTQNTWANQSKQLSSNIEQLKANLGDFLRTALLPLLTALNQIIKRITLATEKFKEFLAVTFNIKFDTSGIAEGSDIISDGLDEIGDAAEETAEAVKKTIGPLDQLNILTDKSSQNGHSAVSGLGIGSIDAIDYGVQDAEKTNGFLDKIGNKVKEIAASFKEGFDERFDPTKWERIEKSVEGIADSIIDIVTDKRVQKAADDYAKRSAKAFGRITADVANIAGSIGVNITEGFNRALNSHKEEIKTAIIEAFDFEARKKELVADAADAIADIAEVFESEGAIRITAALDGIWLSVESTGIRIYERLSTDILDTLVRPLTENTDKIKENIQAITDQLAPMFEAVERFTTGAGQSLIDMYDQHIHPAFVALGDFLSDITGFVNDILKPLIDKYMPQISDWFVDLIDNKIKPLWETIMNGLAESADLFRNELEIIKPILEVILAVIAAVISVILDVLIPVIENVINVVVDCVDSIIMIITGCIEVINGLITGDFTKAIEGIVHIIGGIMEQVATIVDGVINTIIDSINNLFGTTFSHTNLVGWVKNLVASLVGSETSKSSGPSPHSGNVRDRGYSSSMDGYHFANGGVFEPNHEILGVLGDNKVEREYALTESHLDSIARRTANIIGGGASTGGSPNFNLQLQIDGEWLDARILSVTETNDYRG